MQLTITAKKENSLLQRIELQGRVEFQGTTPSNLQVAEAIAKTMKSEIPAVVVKSIHNLFGKQAAAVNALVYNSLEAKSAIEKSAKHLNNKKKEEKKEAEKKAGVP